MSCGRGQFPEMIIELVRSEPRGQNQTCGQRHGPSSPDKKLHSRTPQSGWVCALCLVSVGSWNPILRYWKKTYCPHPWAPRPTGLKYELSDPPTLTHGSPDPLAWKVGCLSRTRSHLTYLQILSPATGLMRGLCFSERGMSKCRTSGSRALIPGSPFFLFNMRSLYCLLPTLNAVVNSRKQSEFFDLS